MSASHACGGSACPCGGRRRTDATIAHIQASGRRYGFASAAQVAGLIVPFLAESLVQPPSQRWWKRIVSALGRVVRSPCRRSTEPAADEADETARAPFMAEAIAEVEAIAPAAPSPVPGASGERPTESGAAIIGNT